MAMRVLQVHNRYRLRGGEDAVVEATLDLLGRRGHEARLFDKHSDEVAGGALSRLSAVFSAIYSRSSRREMERIIDEWRPDVVHVHNLYPLLSPSVLAACRARGVPVVMTCHNYRLVCPIAVHFVHGALCEACVGGREYRCFTNNCRDSRLESAAYALRNYVTRRAGLFLNNITLYLSISEFLKKRLIEAGVPEQRIEVVPNMIRIPAEPVDATQGAYAGFAGRASEEKGIPVLVDAARRLPDVPVHIAGHGPLLETLTAGAPGNVVFPGMLTRAGLDEFYCRARFLVVPSVWHETFGLVAVEAMSRGIPVIASRMGGLQELIEDGVSGFLFAPGDAEDLAGKMRRLWADPDLCGRMGRAAREQAVRRYHEDVHYEMLIAAYARAIAITKGETA